MSFDEIRRNIYLSEDRKHELCIEKLKRIKDFIKISSEEFLAEDKSIFLDKE